MYPHPDPSFGLKDGKIPKKGFFHANQVVNQPSGKGVGSAIQ
jgi:hypothetical protein